MLCAQEITKFKLFQMMTENKPCSSGECPATCSFNYTTREKQLAANDTDKRFSNVLGLHKAEPVP